jgi:hypothetical protein
VRACLYPFLKIEAAVGIGQPQAIYLCAASGPHETQAQAPVRVFRVAGRRQGASRLSHLSYKDYPANTDKNAKNSE